MSLLINKRAESGENLLSLWWLAVLAFVGIGIVVGVLLYYSADVNIRGAEATALEQRLVSCLVSQGEITSSFFDESADILSMCDLNRMVFDAQSQFFFSIELLDKDLKAVGGKTRIGRSSYEQDCNVVLGETDLKASEYPACVSVHLPVHYGDNHLGVLHIVSASNQKGVRGAAV